MTDMGAEPSPTDPATYVWNPPIPVIDVAQAFPVRATNHAIMPVLRRTPEKTMILETYQRVFVETEALNPTSAFTRRCSVARKPCDLPTPKPVWTLPPSLRPASRC